MIARSSSDHKALTESGDDRVQTSARMALTVGAIARAHGFDSHALLASPRHASRNRECGLGRVVVARRPFSPLTDVDVDERPQTLSTMSPTGGDVDMDSGWSSITGNRPSATSQDCGSRVMPACAPARRWRSVGLACRRRHGGAQSPRCRRGVERIPRLLLVEPNREVARGAQPAMNGDPSL